MVDNFFKNNMYEDVEEREKRDESVEELIEKYQKRYMTQLATDTHSQFTFLFEDKLKKRLDSIMNSLAVDNGDNYRNEEVFKIRRRLLKGFKFKFINMAVEHMLDRYEKENGKVRNVECITYTIREGVNEKMYIVGDGGNYDLIYHNREGMEIDSELGVNGEQVQDRLREVEDQMVKVGRKPDVKKALGGRYI